MALIYDFEEHRQRLEQELGQEIQSIIDMIMDAVDCEVPVVIAIINLPPVAPKPGLMERVKRFFRKAGDVPAEGR